MIDAAYGTWDSPITAEKICSAVVTFQDLAIDGEDIYWSEMRPTEGGRYVIIKQSPGKKPEEVLPAEYNARTRVHEYGGAAFMVHEGIIYFTNFQDQRLYRLTPHEKPTPITQSGVRFAELKSTPLGIVAIAESHGEGKDPENFLALIDFDTGEVRKLASGYDFYSSPTISKDYQQIAWISWNHPNMPWDNTQLWVADFKKEGLANLHQVDAGTRHQSFFQPQWGPNNELIVASDKSNWWNLYQVKNKKLEPLFTVKSEIGQPLWNLGASSWGFFKGELVCSFFDKGKTQLFLLKEGVLSPMELPFTQFSQLRTGNNKIAFIGGASDRPSAVVLLENGKYHLLRESTALRFDPAYLSLPQHISFPSKDNRQAHAYFYPPKNKDYQGLPGTKPPLIVKSHGGPTANCGSSFNAEIQYWTSRGFAFVDVNYAGSSGYGRAYRKSLEGNWGIYDVEDCEAAAHYLAEKGLVDKNKLAITGGSAGGYTTLAALAFTKTFHVGASHYGVSDLESLAKETHKFESKYLDNLIGEYPKEKKRYIDRSPLHHGENLSAPVIFFQGDEDKIVLPNQAEQMFNILTQKGIKTKYCLFKGEQHGFRKAENRITALEEQRQFFLEAFNQ